MRNRKSLLSISIFALILVLSVGYAVVNYVDLTVGGEISASAENIDVSFKSVNPVKVSDDDDVYGTVVAGQLTGSIVANNLTLNNPVTVTYTIQNNETDVDATITELLIDNDNREYFSVVTDIGTSKTCARSNTLDVKVTVTLIKTPVEADDNSANIDITLRATPVNNKENSN